MATATKAKSAPKSPPADEGADPGAEVVEKTTPKTKAKAKSTTPRKSRAKSSEPPRAKLYWGVYNQNYKRVAVFEYQSKKEAEKHAKELGKSGSEHIVMPFKELIDG